MERDALKTFEFHADIKKHRSVDTDDRLYVEGYASTKNLDRYVEVVSPEAFESTIETYMSNPVVLFQHKHDNPIGQVVEIAIDKFGLWVKAFISKAESAKSIATMIEEGILRAFSIGFREKTATPVDEVYTIQDLELYEISVVSIPANRESLFSVAKAFEHGTDLVEYAMRNEPTVTNEEKTKELPESEPEERGSGVESKLLDFENERDALMEKLTRASLARKVEEINKRAKSFLDTKGN